MFKNKLITISNDGNYLAICNSEGVLKLWDTNSNILEHEFHPSEYLSSEVTCLRISSTIPEKKNFKGTKKKHIKSVSSLLIALGTIEGSVLIYCPNKQEVISKLIHSSTSSVTDLSWQDSNKLLSIGEKKLIIWSTKSNKQLSVIDIKECKSLCVIKENLFITANTNLQYLFYNKDEKSSEIHTIPGHKTLISQLVPVFINNEIEASYFLSAAENDRYVYAWSINPDFKEPLASFMVNDIVRTVSCTGIGESSIAVVVTTQKGFLRVFRHHMNGSKNKKPTRFEMSLKIENATQKSTFLTILNAQFLSTEELLIAYGIELFPHSEKIKLSLLTQNKETVIVREDPSVFTKKKESNLIKNVTPQIPVNSVHLMPAQMNPVEVKEVSGKRKRSNGVESLPMEERLDALSLTQNLPGAPDGRPLDNYVHLLVQALHSKDSSLMNSILAKGEEEEIINNTVRRLPVSYVVPFLKFLQEIITGKGLKNLTCVNWIKSVLFQHMSYLSSVPEKEELLKPFLSVFEARLKCYLAVSKLHGRMSLLLTQVKNRHENATQNFQSQMEPLFKYKDDSSDDEDTRIDMEGGGHSDSDDIWDDWTEEEEEEEEGDDDEDDDEGEKELGEGGKDGKTPKRKLSSQDEDCISISDSRAPGEGSSDEDEEHCVSVDDNDDEENTISVDDDDDCISVDDDDIQSISDGE